MYQGRQNINWHQNGQVIVASMQSTNTVSFLTVSAEKQILFKINRRIMELVLQWLSSSGVAMQAESLDGLGERNQHQGFWKSVADCLSRRLTGVVDCELHILQSFALFVNFMAGVVGLSFGVVVRFKSNDMTSDGPFGWNAEVSPSWSWFHGKVANLFEIPRRRGTSQEDRPRMLKVIESVTYCDADLLLRKGHGTKAETLIKKVLRISSGKWADIESNCLELLSDSSRWNVGSSTSARTTVLLIMRSQEPKQKLGAYTALLILSGIFFSQAEDNTATSLFTVALEGFTYMDVHRHRAECMACLGDISKRNHHLVKAVELW
ncbi:hypothetical protein GGX14DRAFT_404777 [Mycena pura]|uniref:Uncharacterized protein n=1 Tax=Mycena pura TaxID=153505 RepID=A0AAD6UTV7_9AGAR|nr:hypothetical protein GGX14DRAFT_404777 [Mycena pura]